MKILLKDEKGITLVELIIALAISLIVLAVGYNLFSFGLNSFSRESDNVDNQAKARRVLREISLDIRKVDAASIVIQSDEAEETVFIGDVSYTFQKETHTLLKNGEVFVTGVKSFSVEKSTDGRITLKITTLANNGREVSLSSSIYAR